MYGCKCVYVCMHVWVGEWVSEKISVNVRRVWVPNAHAIVTSYVQSVWNEYVKLKTLGAVQVEQQQQQQQLDNRTTRGS